MSFGKKLSLAPKIEFFFDWVLVETHKKKPAFDYRESRQKLSSWIFLLSFWPKKIEFFQKFAWVSFNFRVRTKIRHVRVVWLTIWTTIHIPFQLKIAVNWVFEKKIDWIPRKNWVLAIFWKLNSCKNAQKKSLM